MTNVTLLTAASEAYWPVMELSAPNKLEYCLRHGLQLKVGVHTAPDMFGNWGDRVQMMLDELESPSTEWLWFMGADTLITNMTIDVRALVDGSAADLIIAKDVNGLNNDSFLLQNTLNSRRWLRNVQNQRKAAHDQDAMVACLDDLFVDYVPQRALNSYMYELYEHKYGRVAEGNWEKGDFVLHLPGLPNKRRIKIMEQKLLEVVR